MEQWLAEKGSGTLALSKTKINDGCLVWFPHHHHGHNHHPSGYYRHAEEWKRTRCVMNKGIGKTCKEKKIYKRNIKKDKVEREHW